MVVQHNGETACSLYFVLFYKTVVCDFKGEKENEKKMYTINDKGDIHHYIICVLHCMLYE